MLVNTGNVDKLTDYATDDVVKTLIKKNKTAHKGNIGKLWTKYRKDKTKTTVHRDERFRPPLLWAGAEDSLVEKKKVSVV